MSVRRLSKPRHRGSSWFTIVLNRSGSTLLYIVYAGGGAIGIFVHVAAVAIEHESHECDAKGASQHDPENESDGAGHADPKAVKPAQGPEHKQYGGNTAQ